jgi:ELMO domain-containing protein
VKGNKENVWSVDNELAKKEKKGRGRSKKLVKRNKGKKSGRVVVTGAMLMEVETVLQTQVMFFFFIWVCFKFVEFM